MCDSIPIFKKSILHEEDWGLRYACSWWTRAKILLCNLFWYFVVQRHWSSMAARGLQYDTYDWLDDWRTTYVRVVRPAGERSTDLDHRSWTRARLTSRSKIQMCNACPAHYLLLCVEVKGTRVLNEYSMMNIEYFIPMMNLNYESSIHLRQRKRERHHLSGNNASEKVNTTYSYRSYILQYSNWSSLYLTRTKKDVYPWLLQYLRY